jgi:hypothetical protein
VVFELPIFGPLHADELRRQQGKARFAKDNDGSGIRDRIGEGVSNAWGRRMRFECDRGLCLADNACGERAEQKKEGTDSHPIRIHIPNKTWQFFLPFVCDV